MKLILILALLFACSSKSEQTKPEPGPTSKLRVGVTLHPYYSWTSRVAIGLDIEVVAVLPGDIDAGNYQPSPDDIAKLSKLDAIVINGIGHDDFIRDMINASGNTKIKVIEANAQTPLLPSAHGDAKNSHTFISFTNAIQQSRLIAAKLGELRPAFAAKLKENAAKYADKLREYQNRSAKDLAGAKVKRVVTVHDGYSYLLQEFGIELAGVVQPAHGLVPSAKELGEMIELIKNQKITVVLSEQDFPEKLMTTLHEATGAKVYVLSHVASGEYTDVLFELEMGMNVGTLVRALVRDPP